MALKPFAIASSVKTTGRLLVISDFHDTLSVGGEGIQEDYLRVLIHLHTDGHDVVIASGLPDAAQAEIDESLLVAQVMESIDQSDETKAQIRASLLTVIDKAGQIDALRARGIDMKRIARPDIYIDDAMPQLPAKIHLDPRSEEFEDFVATAQLDLKAALVELFDQNGVFSTLDADGNDEAPGSDLA